MSARAPLSLLLAAALLAGGGLVATVAGGSPAPAAQTVTRQPVRVPVASAVAACPGTGGDPGNGGDTGNGAAPPADAPSLAEILALPPGPVLGADGPGGADRAAGATGAASDGDAGQAVVNRLGGPTVTGPAPAGRLLRADIAAGPSVASGTGSAAPGLDAATLTVRPSGPERGLEGGECLAPARDRWFVGAGSVVGERAELYLTNPTDAVAIADVELWGTKGPIDSTAGRGIAVAPRSQRVLRLDSIAPDQERLGVHVAVRQGRVSAALRDTQVAGLQSLGGDWLPAATDPSRHLVVPLSPGADGTRRLQVLAPADSDAVVALHVVTRDSVFAPAGMESVTVPAGTVGDVDVKPLGGDAQENVALVLDSDVPVTAAVASRRGGLPGTTDAPGDIAWSAASPRLGGPAVLASGCVPVRDAGRVSCEVMLTAPKGAVDADVVTVDADGRTDRQQIKVAAGSLATVGLRQPEGGSPTYAVVVIPHGDQPLYGARLLTAYLHAGPVLTIASLRPAEIDVAVPPVRRDLSSGLRAG